MIYVLLNYFLTRSTQILLSGYYCDLRPFWQQDKTNSVNNGRLFSHQNPKQTNISKTGNKIRPRVRSKSSLQDLLHCNALSTRGHPSFDLIHVINKLANLEISLSTWHIWNIQHLHFIHVTNPSPTQYLSLSPLTSALSSPKLNIFFFIFSIFVKLFS